MSPTTKTIFCYVTDRTSLPNEAALVERIRDAAAAGADWIVLREKDLEARELVQLARAALVAAGAGARILVNDRLDVAAAAGAAGVHLGEASLPVAEAACWRRQAGRKDFLIGASRHSLEGARQAEADGADYLFFGPVFATPSKAAFGPPQGLAKLSEVCRAVSIPVLAVGGVTAENAATCLQAGAAGIAAIRMFQESADLAALLDGLRRRIAEGG